MNSRSTPGAAAVAPATSTSLSGSPLSSTRRRLVSTVSTSGRISAAVRPMCSRAVRPLISAMRSLMRT